MAYLKHLILALLFICNVSFAGYAQLKPPPGWSQGMGAAVPGQAGVFAFGAAANASSFKGTTVLTNAALNIAGQLVTIPVSMRVAANAATIAAEFAYLNPYVMVGVGAAAAYVWYTSNDLKVKDGVWVKTSKALCTANCNWWVTTEEPGGKYYPTAQAAGEAAIAYKNAMSGGDSRWTIGTCSESYCTATVQLKEGSPPKFGTPIDTAVQISRGPVRPADSSMDFPVSKPEFHSIMDPKLVPDLAPPAMPNVGWPVQQPVFNPDPAINPLPAPSPAAVPRPLFIPTGNPVPTSDPNVWNQPGVRVTPAPTPDSPWQVDIKPEDIPQNSPNPKTPAELNPPVPGTPVVPNPDTTQPGLCDQYPGIAACSPAEVTKFCEENPDVLACQKTDTPDVPDLEKKDVPVSITPDSGFGPAGGGYCPSPRQLATAHALFSFQPYCDFMNGIRPVILAVAWFSAALILVGAKGSD